MKKHTIGLGLFIVVAAATLLLVVPNPATQADKPGISINSQIVPGQKIDTGKIDYALYKIIHPEQFADLAKLRAMDIYPGIEYPGFSAQVVIETVVDPVAAAAGQYPAAVLVRNMAESLGGKFETSYQNQVQCQMPPGAIEALAQSDLVQRIRKPYEYKHQVYTSEGVARTGADLWRALDPYRTGGTRAKVAVLDGGFSGYSSRLGTELPSSVTTRSFRADGSITAGESHGTACAEIVYDMYPEVDLYLVNFSTDLQMHNAVTWLINQGVDVISYSIGWWNAGDGRGNGPITEDVKRAAAAGIIWCNSAGNSAEEHWEGTFNGAGNRWHDFATNYEYNYWYSYAYTLQALFLSWDDWGTWSGTAFSGSANDYDLYFYVWDGTHWDLLDWSVGVQNGGGDWPTEVVGYWYSTGARYWGFSIYNWYSTRNCKLEAFSYGNASYLYRYNTEGSLMIPADAPGAQAAGAVDWSDDSYHSYSSQGPTNDGRNKPDFAAPSGTSGSIYGTNGFYGTSASAPHLAGAFGLLKGKTPYTMDQINTILRSRAVNVGDEPNKFGVGRVSVKR